MDRYVAGWKAGTPPPPPKTVYVVRHGESTLNAGTYYPTDINDEVYIDAELTPRGRLQASALAETVASIAPDLIVSSPMTRALHTCQLACAALPAPAPRVVVHPACTERVSCACDVGRPAVEVAKRFTGADFSAVPTGAWWWTGLPAGEGGARESVAALQEGRDGCFEPPENVRARAADLRRWLVSRPERRVVLFCHGVFIRHLLAPSPRELAPYVRNCEVRKLVL
jgi:glucosyl-3-phosphoglycerate phosphatase